LAKLIAGANAGVWKFSKLLLAGSFGEDEMEKITDYRNNCVLVALKEVSGKDDAEIFRAVRNHNYKNNGGMYQSDYMKAATELGIEMSDVRSCYSLFADQFNEMRSRGNFNIPSRTTLTAVLKKLNKGTFLVRTPGHILVIRDGRVVDKNFYKPRLGRSTVDYVEVLNAHQEKKVGGLKAVRRNSRRYGTRAYTIGQQAFDYLAKNPTATAADVLRNCPGYKRNWLDWDIKRGNIVEI
jgi:hypothetical protein